MKMPAVLQMFDKEYSTQRKKPLEEEKTSADYSLQKTGLEGLSTAKAEKILREQGENVLKSGKKNSGVKIFAGQFKDFLVIILLISTAASIFLGEVAEALSIAIIVLLNAIMGFVQEYKTEKTLEALKNMTSPVSKVIRDGRLTQIPASSLVRGDIILLEAGDRVPADCTILHSVSLQAEESILTGESVAVEKQADPSMDSENQLHKHNLVYMGTSIVKGHAKVQVINTGMDTQMGKIADMLGEIGEQQTPLQKRLDELGKYIVLGCLAISALVMGLGILRGYPLIHMVITGVSLAVAAVPEGLPAIVTIALALAIKRMVKRKSLIRKLHAVETLGCATVICSDKTGTLTENRMTVKRVITADALYQVEGNGYQKSGSFLKNNKRVHVKQEPGLNALLEVATLCNNAQFTSSQNQVRRDRTQSTEKGVWRVLGEPTETALLVMAAKAGITPQSLQTEYKIYEENPFDSTRKCMSVCVKTANGRRFLFSKGAYDVLYKKSTRCFENGVARALQPEDRIHFNAANEHLAKNGMRVLGFAFREITSADESETNLIFLGLAGMMDPPRRDAKEAVKLCRRAGIRTIMITGDHKLTACAIGEKVGLFRKGDLCVTGEELDEMSDEALNNKIGITTVFARVSPSHKLRIVRALKRQGEIVAMTGDGVNDAPAVKEADIGVSMGITGSDVTKQAADVILLDDSFATLVTAVEEGRVIYGNIRKFIRYLLSCNIGEVVTMLVGMLMGMPIVLLPMQILMVNLVTDGLPAIALGLDPAEDDCMRKPPRAAEESIFHGIVFTIIFRGILIGLTTLTVFTTIFRISQNVMAAHTAAFLSLVLSQLIHVFECKSEVKPIFKIPFLNNKKLLLAVLVSIAVTIASIYVPQMNLLLKTVPLTQEEILTTMSFTLFIPVVNSVVLSIKNSRIKKRRCK